MAEKEPTWWRTRSRQELAVPAPPPEPAYDPFDTERVPMRAREQFRLRSHCFVALRLPAQLTRDDVAKLTAYLESQITED